MTPGQIASYKRACAELGTDEQQAAADRRARLFADARALLDLLEANPDVPFNGLEIRHAVIVDNDAAGINRIIDAAVALRVSRERSSGHHRVRVDYGTASYQAAYVERGEMERWRRERGWGKSAAGAEVAR